MKMSSNGNIFRITGHLCEEFTGPWWIPCTKASDSEFDVFIDLCLNKWFSKQLWGRWFETLLSPLWCHSNVQVRWRLYIKAAPMCPVKGLIYSTLKSGAMRF